MPSGLGDDSENVTVDAILGTADYPYSGLARLLSLHTSDPNPAGGNEVVGGSYTRKICSWTPASGGSASLATTISFDDMPTCIVTHIGVWTSDGHYLGGGPCTVRSLVAGQTMRLNTGTTFRLQRAA